MLGARLGVLRAGVALDGDPTLLLVLEALALDSGDAGVWLVEGTFDDCKQFADGQLPQDLAVSDVPVIGDRDRRRASKILVVSFGKNGAGLVLGGEPSEGAVKDGLALDSNARLVSQPLGALDQLNQFLGLQRSHRGALALVLAVQGDLGPARVERLLDLLQERGALVPLKGDPTHQAVRQGLGADPGDADLLIRLRPLDHLQDLVGVGLSQGLRIADLEHIGDGDSLHHLEVLLQERLKSSSADAASLNVPAQQSDVLGLEGLAQQRLQVLRQVGVRDLLVALGELAEETLDAQVLRQHLLPQLPGDLPRSGVDKLAAFAADTVDNSLGFLLRQLHLAYHLQQVPLRIHHRSTRRLLRQLRLLGGDRLLRLVGGRGDHLGQAVCVLGDRGGRRERLHLLLRQGHHGLRGLIEAGHRRLQGRHLGHRRREESVGLPALLAQDVRDLLLGLLLAVVLLCRGDLRLQLLHL
mmetsp:Transcript_54377/g.157205  ORF Transcript_54377/g.157205 Transcript_54377/m.157205 type:complete len:469 (+) Transcript_54377:668-2074(+)